MWHTSFSLTYLQMLKSVANYLIAVPVETRLRKDFPRIKNKAMVPLS